MINLDKIIFTDHYGTKVNPEILNVIFLFKKDDSNYDDILDKRNTLLENISLLDD